MSPRLVLDAEALSSLASLREKRFAEVHATLEAARRLRRDVVPNVQVAAI